VVDYALIQKIKVGMTFEEVKRLTHVEPVDYYTAFGSPHNRDIHPHVSHQRYSLFGEVASCT
jgi:hypothetical protein